MATVTSFIGQYNEGQGTIANGPFTANTSGALGMQEISGILKQIYDGQKLGILYYKNKPSQKGLIVGSNLTVEGIGKYEIYVVYSFERQEYTIKLVKNALFIAGLVLIFLIGLITQVVTFRLVAPIRAWGTTPKRRARRL